MKTNWVNDVLDRATRSVRAWPAWMRRPEVRGIAEREQFLRTINDAEPRAAAVLVPTLDGKSALQRAADEYVRLRAENAHLRNELLEMARRHGEEYVRLTPMVPVIPRSPDTRVTMVKTLVRVVEPCTREKPHDGPCNGWLTPECHATNGSVR